jgi:YHS domain-containing protein
MPVTARALRLAAALLVAATGLAHAQMGKGAVNVDASRLALHGYDPVAYVTAGAPAKGSPEFTAEHDGATYRFATAASRDAFKASPARYAPQYGGYCAMGVAVGKKFDVDPMAFRVVDGKLYLNKDLATQKVWLKDTKGHIATAEGKWGAVQKRAGFDG